MKKFTSTVVIRHPLDMVWEAVRDDLPQLALLMDDVESVSVIERCEDADGIVHVTNRWESQPQLPAAVEKLIPNRRIAWIDKASWNTSEHECQWILEPQFLPTVTRCSGRTRYVPAVGNRGTRITFEGTLEVNPHNIPGVPTVLAGTVGTVTESFVTGLIPKNFRKLSDAVSEYLNS